MADIVTKARTNYFSVNNIPKFLQMMEEWDKKYNIRLLKRQNSDGNPLYAFTYDESDLNENLVDLQEFLPESEAVILQQVGYEESINGSLRYVFGTAMIVTSNAIDSIDLSTLALQRVRKLLIKPDYKTILDY